MFVICLWKISETLFSEFGQISAAKGKQRPPSRSLLRAFSMCKTVMVSPSRANGPGPEPSLEEGVALDGLVLLENRKGSSLLVAWAWVTCPSPDPSSGPGYRRSDSAPSTGWARRRRPGSAQAESRPGLLANPAVRTVLHIFKVNARGLRSAYRE